jgi:hypothetical protein
MGNERVQDLHTQLTAAKRKVGDSSTVSVTGLAKSLQATEAKLRAKHAGKNVDFRVVIKDGKAMLKPVLK